MFSPFWKPSKSCLIFFPLLHFPSLWLSKFLQPFLPKLTPLVNIAGLKSQSLLNYPDKCLMCHISNCFVLNYPIITVIFAFPLFLLCQSLPAPFHIFLFFCLFLYQLLTSVPPLVWQPQFHTTSNFLCRSTQSP